MPVMNLRFGWLLFCLVGCSALSPTTKQLASKSPSFFLPQVQVEQKDSHTSVYISPLMTSGPSYVDNLIRCYRNHEKQSFFCQIFAKVQTRAPLGDRLFQYTLQGEIHKEPIQIQKTMFHCGNFCERLNCNQSCYNLNLVSYDIPQALLEHFVALSQLPTDQRRPFPFELAGDGWNPKGELLPAVVQAVLMKMSGQESSSESTVSP